MPETSNKPANTLFKQQRLPAWQPILSPPHVAACFVLIAAIFIPIGIAVFVANDSAVDLEFTYTSSDRVCTPQNNDAIFKYVVNNVTTKMGCAFTVAFDIDKEMEAPIYMYYKLTNFYQNHRRFAKSRSDKQLAGDIVSSGSMEDAAPLINPGEYFDATGTSLSVNGAGTTYGNMVYNPAGLVAWSMFNDSFALYSINGTNRALICNASNFDKTSNEPITQMGCHKKGIAWSTDVSAKYKTPSFNDQQWTARRSLYGAAPLTTDNDYLMNGWYASEPGHEVPVTTDEDFMVWMRTASLPTFRKLYRVIDVNLPPGKYHMDIIEQYDTSSFDGDKAFALATVSWAGGKNNFLAIAYIVVGGIVLLAGIIFFIVHKICADRSQQAIEQLMQEMK
eukprot:GILI01005235.1.p1 GENE.GILI01005235.1~~GILI01005235.1.p1  ORF type:complete len:392 (+),score=63.33 GILI01005235.1:47-1222(+)